MNNYVKRMRAA
ncbi:hypothetical protein D030_2891A, partial [Vibrio parahaemolyticus AQ3810]